MGLVTVSHLLEHLNGAAVFRSRMSHSLTGLPGAAIFEAGINARLAAGRPAGIVWAEIDGLEAYTEEHGGAHVDEVLILAAGLAREVVAALDVDDLAGHVAGDHFVVVCAPDLAALIGARPSALFAKAIDGRDGVSGRTAVVGLRLRAVTVCASEVDDPSYLSLIQEASRRARVRAALSSPDAERVGPGEGAAGS